MRVLQPLASSNVALRPSVHIYDEQHSKPVLLCSAGPASQQQGQMTVHRTGDALPEADRALLDIARELLDESRTTDSPMYKTHWCML